MRSTIRAGVTVLILLAVTFGLCPQAGAQATADQYYKAGLQLYQAKDYAKAVQYFDAALKVDPNMAAAAQGAGNCFVAQNQPALALPYYEKALALNPGDANLASFVQNLKTQVGAAAPAAAAPAVPATGGSYAQGKALFDAKQYAQAQPLFQQALTENPLDANANFYLGYCQYMAGDKKGAVLSFSRSARISPNATADSYAQRVRAGLTPEEMAWVDAELAKPTPAAGAAAISAAAPVKKASFGIRLLPGIQMFTLGDLKKDSDARKTYTALLQETGFSPSDGHGPDPSVGLEGKIASGGLAIALEPFVPMGDNMELGMHVETMMVGEYETTITNNNEDVMEFTWTNSYKFSAMPLGLSFRYLFGAPEKKLRPYLGLSALYLLSSIDLSETRKFYNNLDETLTGTLKGNGIGGAFSLGVDFAIGPSFKVSPFVSYRMLKAKNYKGTVNSSVFGSYNAELKKTTSDEYISPDMVIAMPTGDAAIAGFDEDFASKMSSIEVDFGGLNAGLMIGLYF